MQAKVVLLNTLPDPADSPPDPSTSWGLGVEKPASIGQRGLKIGDSTYIGVWYGVECFPLCSGAGAMVGPARATLLTD